MKLTIFPFWKSKMFYTFLAIAAGIILYGKLEVKYVQPWLKERAEAKAKEEAEAKAKEEAKQKVEE